MTSRRTLAVVRSWAGLLAAAVVLVSAAWLLAEYVRAVNVEPAEKARVEALKERARTDAAIHAQLLQPEFDRQRVALQRRVRIYRRVGLVLLISLGALLAWLKWLEPRTGEWIGVPAALARPFGSMSSGAEGALAVLRKRPKRKVKKALLAARPTVANKALAYYRVLDTCSGCTVCAQVCPVNAIEARPYKKHEVIDDRCTRCGLCVPACPEQAIEVVEARTA